MEPLRCALISKKENAMRKVCFAVSLLVMLHSPLARAEEPALPQPVIVVANVLQLTDAQVRDLVKMIQDRDAAIRPIAENVQANHSALAQLLGTTTPDPVRVGQLVIEIHNGETRVAEISQTSAATFANTLTSEQQQRMQSVIQAAQIAPAVPAFKALGLI